MLCIALDRSLDADHADICDGANLMTPNADKIRSFRSQIPEFACKPGCHDCCGPVLTSTEEMARLPRKSRQAREAALADLRCPHLGENGCTVYHERPLVCRLFGTTPRLACPNGCKPAAPIDPAVAQEIFLFFKETRHVLV